VLRPNLATRPFYNERVIHVALGLAALLVLALTAWNVIRLTSLSQHSAELSSRVSRDRGEADRLTQQAIQIRRSVNNDELALVVTAAREANSLIDQRTFSWTAFFNQIEATIPPDVMLTSVRPSVKDGETKVTMIVMAKRPEDVDEFVEKLEATGAFGNPLETQQDRTDQGLYRVVLDTTYTPTEQEAAPEAAPAADPAAAAPSSPPAANPPAAAPPTARGETPKAPPSKAPASKGGRQ
jgi:type IV pilus assembly protein PilN